MKRRTLALLLCLLMLGLLSADERVVNTVGRVMPPDAAPLTAQVYRFLSVEPVSLNRGRILDPSSESELLFERLCMLNHNNELIPGTADRWDASKDGKTWTFHLRKGAQWSDGRPVTASDFEYSFSQWLHPDTANVDASGPGDRQGVWAYVQRNNVDSTSLGIRATDDFTLVIQTDLPCPYLPYLVASSIASPIPRWQVEKFGAKWAEPGNCLSNSSYQLTAWDRGRSMTFTLNPHYDGPNKGYLERIVRLFPEAGQSVEDASLRSYEQNEVDAAFVSPNELARLEADPIRRKELAQFPVYMTTYLFLRTTQPPFNNLRVRQAFSHAIDREQLSKAVLRGTGIPAYTMLPPGFPGYVGDQYKSIQRYDPKLAKKLLAEAGYPAGRGFPKMELWIVNTQRLPIAPVAQAVQGMLKATLGVESTINLTENRVYQEALSRWAFPLSITTFDDDFPDPHSLLGAVWHSQPKGSGRHDWSNPYFDTLIDQAGATVDQATRMQFYGEAERILASDVGGVFLFHSLAVQARKPWVKGYKRDKQGCYPFYPNNTSFCDIYIGNQK